MPGDSRLTWNVESIARICMNFVAEICCFNQKINVRMTMNRCIIWLRPLPDVMKASLRTSTNTTEAPWNLTRKKPCISYTSYQLLNVSSDCMKFARNLRNMCNYCKFPVSNVLFFSKISSALRSLVLFGSWVKFAMRMRPRFLKSINGRVFKKRYGCDAYSEQEMQALRG